MRHLVLDHGYVELVDSMGSDERVVESARMSTGKGFNGWGPIHAAECPAVQWYDPLQGPRACSCSPQPGDEKLLRYLWKNKHATPFETCLATLEVQAPIFVFREWHRHRTQSYNEMSARYAPLPDVNYVPTVERLMLGGGHLTKQAGTVAGAAVLDELGAQTYREWLINHYAKDQRLYEQALEMGVPKELARVHLPVGRYSRMRATANLRNWLGFLALRLPPTAQWEIRMFAAAVHAELSMRFPRTLALFDEDLPPGSLPTIPPPVAQAGGDGADQRAGGGNP